jgi:hypothetical protein
LFKQAATTQTIVPVIPAIAAVAAIVADATAVPPVPVVPAILEFPAVPETILFGGFQNMIENYPADNFKNAVINASVTWDNNLSQRKCLRRSGR